jgi:hypothetical protein
VKLPVSLRTAAEAANYVLIVFLHLSGMNLFDAVGSMSFADHFQAQFSASAKLPEKHQANKCPVFHHSGMASAGGFLA